MTRPLITLDGDALRANARAFEALGAPVAAVLKSDGYGWGAERLARELDGIVESYIVGDLDELAALRPATAAPIRVLSDAPSGWLARTLELGGIPNVSSRESLAEAVSIGQERGPFSIRVGVLDAAGWYTIRPQEASDFAAAVAGSGLRVELWTHITARERRGEILDGFRSAQRAFEAAGISVISTDLASTAWAGPETACHRFRIGVGLFGARMGAQARTRCAVRVTGPVVRTVPQGGAGWAGYGTTRASANHPIAVLRCGYGDGYPKTFAGTADILSVGMQYTTRLLTEDADVRVLIGEADDVDELAARTGLSPHELVVGLACR